MNSPQLIESLKAVAQCGALGVLGLPYLIAIVNQPTWPKWTRTLTTMLLCVAGGVLVSAVNGALDNVTTPVAIVTCLVSTNTYYHAYLRKTGLTDAVENRTAISKISVGRHTSDGDPWKWRPEPEDRPVEVETTGNTAPNSSGRVGFEEPREGVGPGVM